MPVRIVFKGPLAQSLGTSEVNINAEKPTTIREVLVELIERYSEAQKIWPTPEMVDQESLILYNGADIALMDGLDTRINDGDSVTILPLIHGGSILFY